MIRDAHQVAQHPLHLWPVIENPVVLIVRVPQDAVPETVDTQFPLFEFIAFDIGQLLLARFTGRIPGFLSFCGYPLCSL